MSKRKSVHVVPHQDKWVTKTENSSRVGKIFEKQSDAIEAGRTQAKNTQSEFFIHNKQGQIRAKDSYGNDKYPPKG